jgi:hypothetical protein
VWKVFVATLLACTVSAAHVTGQEFSERRQIAIFRLNYYGAPRDPVPQSETVFRIGNIVRYERRVESETTEIFRQAVGAIDEQIRSVFINIGRFDVIGLTQRIEQENIHAFVDALRQYKEDNLEIPEAVLVGEQAFTEQDFNRLVGGFILVVPTVSYYNIERDDNQYNATIETSFTFINVEDFSTIGQFFVETTGSSDDAVRAMREAVNGIPPQLTYRIRMMDVFRLRTGVLEVAGRSIILEFGQNMGLKRGDEYAVVQTRTIGTGHRTAEETGLIVIREVREEFSIGRLLYARPRVVPGDQLREVPRVGVEISPYGAYVMPLDGPSAEDIGVLMFGLKGVVSRGYYSWRPLAGLEIPTTATIFGFLFPMNVYLGGEYNIYLARLRLVPSFAVGLGGAVPVSDFFDEDFYTTHVGGHLKLSLSYLVTRDTMFVLETGVTGWYGLYDRVFEETIVDRFFGSYGGILFGAGVTFK